MRSLSWAKFFFIHVKSTILVDNWMYEWMDECVNFFIISMRVADFFFFNLVMQWKRNFFVINIYTQWKLCLLLLYIYILKQTSEMWFIALCFYFLNPLISTLTITGYLLWLSLFLWVIVEPFLHNPMRIQKPTTKSKHACNWHQLANTKHHTKGIHSHHKFFQSCCPNFH